MISSQMLHEAVRLYLELAQEAADVIYKGVGCRMAGAPEYWQMAQEVLAGRVALEVAVRAYGAKYARRSVGLRKSLGERVLMASDMTPGDLALPYEMSEAGLWTPIHWRPYNIRDAGDLRLTLEGAGRPLVFVNLDNFIRNSDSRFQLMAELGGSPWSSELFGMDRLNEEGVKEGLAAIEERHTIIFISATRANGAVYEANVDWLDRHGIWSPGRRLMLRPEPGVDVGRGTPWKAEMIWQEIRRLAPPVVILGDDREDTQHHVLEESSLEVLGPTPFIRTAGTFPALVLLAKRLVL